ncbi:MAG: ThuA domain-containing protein [Planctomycetaceae bacterium]
MVCRALLALAVFAISVFPAAGGEEPGGRGSVLLIGKQPDHPYGTHMYLHASRMLGECARLNGYEPIVSDGWPTDAALLKGVKTIVVYASPAAELLLDAPHRDEVLRLLKDGVGLMTIHWASTITKDNLERLGDRWIGCLGGTWVSDVKQLSTDKSELKQLLPSHPICRGWSSYELRDEYYLNPRIKEAQPLLQVTTKGQDVVVGWVFERPDGGRSFATTLGHFYGNFEHEPFRRMIVNGMVWTAKGNVPETGSRIDVADEFLKLPPAPEKKP